MISSKIQNLLDKKENRKLRRIKSSASSSSAITLNESVSNRKEEEEMTNTILDLLPNEELYNTRTLVSLSDKVMNSPLVDDPLLSDRSDSRPTSSASPQLRMKLKKSKFANNAFYQTTQSRMRTGDPDLDKFNPSILENDPLCLRVFLNILIPNRGISNFNSWSSLTRAEDVANASAFAHEKSVTT